MRIAVWHNLPSGGGKRALYHQIRGLRERGHHVEIWCPPSRDDGFLPLSEHVVPLLPTRYLPLPLRLRALEEHCRRCARAIDEGGFDVLLVHPCARFRVAPIGRFSRLPKVLYLQEPYRWLYEALPRSPWDAGPWTLLARSRQAREEIRNARAFDRILVNSLFSRESALRAYGLEAEVCPVGVDDRYFRPLGLERRPWVVGVGGIYHGKGIDRIVRAVAAIEPSVRPPLLWIGNFADVTYRRDLERLAASLGVHLALEVAVGDGFLRRALNRARVFAYAPRLEPFGMAPLEANACGLPVVALAEGGVRESIRDGVNGVLVEGADPRAMGAAIESLLARPARAAALGRRARAFVRRRWSWERAVSSLEGHLREVAHPLSPPRGRRRRIAPPRGAGPRPSDAT